MNELLAAPPLAGITTWFNSQPLRLSDLSGKVIGVEFWTHSCGNCNNAVPHLNNIYKKYKNKGFILIGVHSPELPSDKDEDKIAAYLTEKKITFPVAVDNNLMTWQLYGQRYWPTLYLLDKQGRVSSRHIGEGGYDVIEKEIQHLLEQKG